jgi:hypothetical protein
LAGGTSLALQIRHRLSIDLVFFTQTDFDANSLSEFFEQELKFQQTFITKNTLKGLVNNVHIEFIAHKYPLINDLSTFECYRLYSLPDIAAMKLNAISGNGTRVKDFIDIYYLLNKFSIEDMLGFFEKKYNQKNSLLVLKSLIWYDDVELADWPVMIKDPKITWAEIKKKIKNEVTLYHKSLR